MTKQYMLFIFTGVIIMLVLEMTWILSIAKNQHKTASSHLTNPSEATVPTKGPPLQTSFLSFQQKSATSSAIILDTGNKAVTGVQLDIAFDPAVIHDIEVQPGPFFAYPLTLLNTIDDNKGSIFYVLAMPPTGIARKGKGEVATLYYSFNSGAFNPTIFQFRPRTRVAAEGIDVSVLRAAAPITVTSQ